MANRCPALPCLLIGSLSSVGGLEGELSGAGSLRGEITAVEAPVYGGPYVVVPGPNDIVLQTAGKIMEQDIIIRAIS